MVSRAIARPDDPIPFDPLDRAAYYRGVTELAAAPFRAPATSRADSGPGLPRGLTPGRQTGAATDGTFSMFGWKTIPRRAYAQRDIRTLDISRMAPYQVMEVLAEVSPEVSQALWNMLLLTNSGYSFDVLDSAGNTDEQGQLLLTDIIDGINVRGGGLNALINQWHYTAYLQGAIAGEIALTPSLTDVEDIYAVSPWTIQFVKRDPRPIPQQWLPSERQPRTLNEETFWYLPLFPAVDDPYGRMPFASVLAPLSFDLQLLRDLQVAVHANAWDRLDITVLESVITEAMPDAQRHDPKQRARWVNSVIDDVRGAFDLMRPDDHIIHTDGTKVGPVTSGNRSVGVVPVFRLLERRIIRGLKQLPILMGSNEGTTETHGTVQYEVFVDGLRAVQQLVKAMLDRMLTLALQVRGHLATVVMTWDDIRTTDRKADADAEAVEIANAVAKRDQGWIEQDTASDEVTGSPAVLPGPVPKQLPSTINALPVTQRLAGNRADVRTTHDRIEATLLAIMARHFREMGDAFPTDEIAARAHQLAHEDGELRRDAVLALLAAWFATMPATVQRQQLIDSLTEALVAGYSDIGRVTLRELGIGGTFTLTNDQVLTSLDAYVVMRAGGFDDETQQRLLTAVLRGAGGDGTADDIAAELRGTFSRMADVRSGLIAATETVALLADAQQETWRRNGVKRNIWHTQNDDRVEEHCAANEGAVIGIGERFPSGDDAPPIHAGCRCYLTADLAGYVPPDDPWRGE